MSYIDELTDYLPDIMSKRMELKPLTKEQAKDAILIPAQKTDIIYNSPTFEYQNEAVTKIIDYLTNNGKQPVETTQLQLICQRFENAIIDKNKLNKLLKITNEDIPDFKNIFRSFYHECLDKLPQNVRDKAQLLVENELIRKQQRILLDKLVCETYISDQQLLMLENTRLIRPVPNNTGGISYELSHDTLVEPISETRKERILKEEEDEKLRIKNEELRIANQKAEQDRIEREKERKRQRKVILMVGSVAVVAIIAFIIAIFLYFDAQEQKKIAEQKEKDLKEVTTRYYLRDALGFMDIKEYKSAMDKFIYLRDTILQGETTNAIEKRITECKNLMIYEQEYDSIMSIVKSFANDEKYYSKIVELYEHALKTDMDDDLIKSALKDLKEKVLELANKYSTEAKALDGLPAYVNQKNMTQTKANEMNALVTKIENLLLN